MLIERDILTISISLNVTQREMFPSEVLCFIGNYDFLDSPKNTCSLNVC